jgi:hypothetical protein
VRIVLVVQPWRLDYYSHLAEATGIDWILLWYEKPSQETADLPAIPFPFKEIIYWGDYRTPSQLLKKVKPDRILFYEIIDLRQIALIVTAGAKEIPTYFSDHGAAGDKEATIKYIQTRTFKTHTLPYLVNRVRYNFLNALRSKLFFFSVFKGFKSFSSYLKYFLLPFKMLLKSSHEVLLHTRFKERIPAIPIVFNEPNYEDFESYTGASKDEVFFPGVPFFDKYFRTTYATSDYLVYIEHPYYEDNLANWTLAHHGFIAKRLFAFAEKNKVKIYIKLHPRSDKKLWDAYDFNRDYIEILQGPGDFTELYLNAKLIVAFSSSLVNGFLSIKKNVVLVGWNPEPHIEGADFSKTGLCHASLHIEELDTKYEYWLSHNLTIENEANYVAFLKKYNYPFDGKASQRIIQALKDPASVQTGIHF